MMQFAEQFSDFEIVSAVTTQLSWTHFVEILPLKNTKNVTDFKIHDVFIIDILSFEDILRIFATARSHCVGKNLPI